MRDLVVLSAVAALGLAGCQTAEAPATASGKQEVSIKASVPAEKAH
ncbi:uncharacterized protein YcfL [Nitrobacteraceae bacterium AZCC 2146]|jgi:uncharacterized protein YcfL